MGDIAKVQVVEYRGDMSSLEDLIKNLRLDPQECHFNIITKEIYLRNLGMKLRPGDYYHVAIPPERFEAI